MRKYDAWNIVIIKFQICLVVKKPVSESAARSDGHRGEEGLARHVAQGVHALDVGVLEGVGDDVTRGVHLQADLPRPELICVRSPADSPEQNICRLQLLSIVKTNDNSVILLLNLGNLNISLNLYPAVFNLLCDCLGDLKFNNFN